MSDIESPELVDDAQPAEAPKKGSSTAGFIGEWVGIILAAFVVSLLIKTYVVQTFYIPSASMENTLLINDHLLVNKLSYKVGDVKRSDIVVFKTPPGEPDKTIDDLIKRVIAVPGDTVEDNNGVVSVNGNRLTEPYALPDHAPSWTFAPIKLGPNQYWVMGDNRGDSSDSRVFGAISGDLIVGKAEFRVWPLGRFGTL